MSRTRQLRQTRPTRLKGWTGPPYPGELGKRIWESVSARSLGSVDSLPDDADQREPAQSDGSARQKVPCAAQMENYFFGEGADKVSGYVPPSA